MRWLPETFLPSRIGGHVNKYLVTPRVSMGLDPKCYPITITADSMSIADGSRVEFYGPAEEPDGVRPLIAVFPLDAIVSAIQNIPPEGQ
jgi:hypothetical protein